MSTLHFWRRTNRHRLKYLVRHGDHNLLVDCGFLFQGYKALRLRNRTPCPYAPDQLDAEMLTHAHLDHSGYFTTAGQGRVRGARSTPVQARDLCKSCCPTAVICKKKTRLLPTAMGFQA